MVGVGLTRSGDPRQLICWAWPPGALRQLDPAREVVSRIVDIFYFSLPRFLLQLDESCWSTFTRRKVYAS